MIVHFDPAFDTGAWPDALAGRGAVIGEARLGTAGLLGFLETHLGLAGPETSRVDRLAAVMRGLRGSDGFWRASAETDAIGTARHLLRLRDDLWTEGWRGEPVSGRLRQLADVTAETPPGTPDRVAAVEDALAAQGSAAAKFLDRLVLYKPSDLPAPWRRIVVALERAGVEVVAVAPLTQRPAAPHAAVQLLQGQGPLDTADEAAAWIAQPYPGETVVVGPDPVLDAAMRRRGLPGLVSRAAGPSAVLQVVPLAMELAWSPCDPQAARDLLLLPVGPVPPAVGTGLARALTKWPAVDSDAWRASLAAGLDRLPEGRRAAVRERVTGLFQPGVPHGTACPVGELERRADILRRWIHGRLAATGEAAGNSPGIAPDATGEALRAAATQLTHFTALVGASGASPMSAPGVRRCIDAATAGLGLWSPELREAGPVTIGDPSGVVGPAQRILWWSFTRATEPAPAALPVTPGEQRELEARGVTLRTPVLRAEARAERYRRPWHMATDALVLACPRNDERGDPCPPHPLWDEIAAGLDRASTHTLKVPRPTLGAAAPTRRVPLAAPPGPRRAWHVPPGVVGRRGRESPSGLGALLGCPFQWLGKYHAGLRSGLTAPLPDTARLVGSLSHELLASVLSESPASADQAGEMVGALFDREGPRLAAPLFLPGGAAARADARRLAVEAARTVFDIVEGSGLRVTGVEQELEAPSPIGPLGGRADLVLGDAVAVLDLKHGGASFRLQEMEAGAAYQLAAYAYLLRATAAGEPGDPRSSQAPFPRVAYFILRGQRLLTPEPGLFAGAEVAGGPAAEVTWAATLTAAERRFSELADGILEAPGNPDDDGEVRPTKPVLDAERGLLIPAVCQFCDLGGLCGRDYGGAP